MTELHIQPHDIQTVQNLLHETPQQTVQQDYEDSAEVTACLADAVTYFHANLTSELRSHITSKWGIEPQTIDELQIGYTHPPQESRRSSLVEFLLEQGHTKWAILRTGLVSCPALSHVFDCDPITGSSCYHTVPPAIDLLSALYSVSENTHRYATPSLVERTQLDYKAIADFLSKANCSDDTNHDDSSFGFGLTFWWDHRIVFPYRQKDGTVSYLIGRRTSETEDTVYDNGITDWTDSTADTLTVLCRTGPQSGLVCDPPAVAVSPGTAIQFQNYHNQSATLSVEYSTDNAWTSGPLNTRSPQPCPSGGTYLYTITTSRGSTRGAVLATDSIRDAQLIDPITDWLEDTPNWTPDIAKYLKLSKTKPWVHPTAITEPIYGIDTVVPEKTLLVTEGITDAIVAHQYGIPTISPAATEFNSDQYSEILAAAETASDVVVAMDNDSNNAGLDGALKMATLLCNNGIPARIAELPRPDGVDSYDVADFLQQHTKTQFIQCLENGCHPRDHPQFTPDDHDPSTSSQSPHQQPHSRGQSSTQTPAQDCDISQRNSLSNANTQYSTADDTQARSQARQQPTPTAQLHTRSDGGTQSQSDTPPSENSRAGGHQSGSAVFDLTLYDAAEPGALDLAHSGGADIEARGTNPLLPESPSNSFVLFDAESAYDHWQAVEQSYNPVTWLCCKAGTRSPKSPAGQLSDAEVWQIWKYAKTTSHVTYPSDTGSWNRDPVPVRALWHLARVHEVCPPVQIPDSYDDPRLPTEIYNRVLDIILCEYNLNPGRDVA